LLRSEVIDKERKEGKNLYFFYNLGIVVKHGKKG
jgi:hypothetical protein